MKLGGAFERRRGWEEREGGEGEGLRHGFCGGVRVYDASVVSKLKITNCNLPKIRKITDYRPFGKQLSQSLDILVQLYVGFDWA